MAFLSLVAMSRCPLVVNLQVTVKLIEVAEFVEPDPKNKMPVILHRSVNIR